MSLLACGKCADCWPREAAHCVFASAASSGSLGRRRSRSKPEAAGQVPCAASVQRRHYRSQRCPLESGLVHPAAAASPPQAHCAQGRGACGRPRQPRARRRGARCFTPLVLWLPPFVKLLRPRWARVQGEPEAAAVRPVWQQGRKCACGAFHFPSPSHPPTQFLTDKQRHKIKELIRKYVERKGELLGEGRR